MRFHPSCRLVATGSADRQFKVFTCYVNKTRKTDNPDGGDGEIVYSDDNNDDYNGPFDDIETFGECLFSVKANTSWINAVAFSPCGNNFAFTCTHHLAQQPHPYH